MRAFLLDCPFNLTNQALQLFPIRIQILRKSIRATRASGHAIAWFGFGQYCNRLLAWFWNATTPWCSARGSDFDFLLKRLGAILCHHLAWEWKIGNGIFWFLNYKRNAICAFWNSIVFLQLRCLFAWKTAQYIDDIFAGFFIELKTFFKVKARARTR